MEKIEKVLASGNTHATVNRDPNLQRGEFGVFDLKLTAPGVESLEFIATEPHPTSREVVCGRVVGLLHHRVRDCGLAEEGHAAVRLFRGHPDKRWADRYRVVPRRRVHHPRAGSGQGSRRGNRAPDPSDLPVLEVCARQHRDRHEHRHGVIHQGTCISLRHVPLTEPPFREFPS